jgi:hypothetical protein
MHEEGSPTVNVMMVVGCLTAHRQIGHIGPTLGVDAVYCHAQDQCSCQKELLTQEDQ